MYLYSNKNGSRHNHPVFVAAVKAAKVGNVERDLRGEDMAVLLMYLIITFCSYIWPIYHNIITLYNMT